MDSGIGGIEDGISHITWRRRIFNGESERVAYHPIHPGAAAGRQPAGLAYEPPFRFAPAAEYRVLPAPLVRAQKFWMPR